MFFGKMLKGKSRKPLLFIIDVMCFAVITVMYYAATKLFDASPKFAMNEYIFNTASLFVSMFGFRLALRVYRNIWRYTNTYYY